MSKSVGVICSSGIKALDTNLRCKLRGQLLCIQAPRKSCIKQFIEGTYLKFAKTYGISTHIVDSRLPKISEHYDLIVINWYDSIPQRPTLEELAVIAKESGTNYIITVETPQQSSDNYRYITFRESVPDNVIELCDTTTCLYVDVYASDNIYVKGDARGSIATGVCALDAAGYQLNNEVAVFHHEPGIGATRLILATYVRHCLKGGRNVAVYEVDEPVEWMERVLGLSSERIKTIPQYCEESLAHAVSKYAANDGAVALVVIDGIQEIVSRHKLQNTVSELSAVCKNYKINVVLSCNVPDMSFRIPHEYTLLRNEDKSKVTLENFKTGQKDEITLDWQTLKIKEGIDNV